MKVHFVGAGPGDPELLTVAADRMLRTCSICVYAGSLVNPRIVDLLPRDCEKHDSGTMDLEQIVAVYRDAMERGLDVLRLHSGDPSIYGATREQMNELERLGIDYEVIPGVSSFQAAAAALRTELTAPEISQTIILTRSSGRTPMPEKEELSRLAGTGSTLCIFLSAHKLRAVAEELAVHYGPDCPAAVVYRASWPDEKIVRGTLSDIAEKTDAAGIRKTAIIVVGYALLKDIPASRLYDPAFSHEYRAGRRAHCENGNTLEISRSKE